MRITTVAAEETVKLGERLGRHLKSGDVLGLVGELGSGKTTLVKGIASGLGVRAKEQVCSPSFVLIKEYSGRIPLYHFDLYRLEKMKEVELLGLQEYLFDDGVCVIEWAEKMKTLLPDYLRVDLTIKGAKEREIKFVAHHRRYQALLAKL